jgi:hypothetical protein
VIKWSLNCPQLPHVARFGYHTFTVFTDEDALIGIDENYGQDDA